MVVAAPATPASRATLASGLSLGEWVLLARGLQISPQQGHIVRLMMTLPGEDDGNTNAKVALAMSRERQARFGPVGIVCAGGSGKIKKGTGPVAVKAVDTQVERIYEKLGIHSRIELAQRVDFGIAAMRGWIRSVRR